ncbi:alpha/beta hydrolase [Streptomyces sp. I05A-00742]|uniref:alpha/beta hydrolase n=1 Tax=Streptomyces sp. I05A-00742 TaxID=2732853 RepID=UPI0014880E69|nr:alpha/beta hydrolase [Streptomyces sp. I05A-00742]
MTAADEESELFGLPYVPPDATTAYGPHPDQIIDHYLPTALPNGVLVTLLHGGFWRLAYDRRHLAPLASALAAHGFDTALAEYRRVGGGGGWPATFEDVLSAVAASGPARRHVLVGHSAGGQLALCAAARPDVAVDAVVAVAPVADLARARATGTGGDAVDALLGGRETVEADPAQLLPRVPVTVLHGAADTDVPVELSHRYTAAARLLVRADLHVLPGTGHYAPVTPGTPACAALLNLVASSVPPEPGPGRVVLEVDADGSP